MPLLTENVQAVFDLQAVRCGDLIRAQYHTWPEPRNGIVAAAFADRLSVLYLPGIGNVSNYFPIPAAEVAAGKWKVSWSGDMEVIQKEGFDDDGGTDIQPPDDVDSNAGTV